MPQVIRRIRRLLAQDPNLYLYPGAQAGFEALFSFRERDGDNETLARQFPYWVVDRGIPHGIRLPTSEERLRGTGAAPLLRALDLPTPALMDAAGSHFDPRAFLQRCLPLLQGWERRQPPPAARAPLPTCLTSYLLPPAGRHAVDVRSSPYRSAPPRLHCFPCCGVVPVAAGPLALDRTTRWCVRPSSGSPSAS